MPPKFKQNDYKALKKSLRPFTSGKLLLLFIAISVGQYSYTGSVNWITDAFRWVETSARSLANNPGASIEPAYKLSGRVSKVADGDTITLIDAQRKKYKVRLFGIDSPESDQPYYRAAKDALSKLVNGKPVGVDVEDTDKYGRVVGTVFLDGRNVNQEMVKLGYAWWYEYYAPLNDDLREAQEYARASKSGLWADSKPTAPWDWRRRTRR